jgi:hypothetical protein
MGILSMVLVKQAVFAVTYGWLEVLTHAFDYWDVPVPGAVLLMPASTNFTVNSDGRILFTARRFETTRIGLPLSSGWLAAIRLELIPHKKHGHSIVQGTNETTSIELRANLRRASGKETSLALSYADADYKDDRWLNGSLVIGVEGIWNTSSQHRNSKQTSVWMLNKPIRVDNGETLILDFGRTSIGCVRVSVSPLAEKDPLIGSGGNQLRQALSSLERSGSQVAEDMYLLSTAWDKDAYARYRKLAREMRECRGGKSPTLVTVAWKPAATRVPPRGNWQDESGEVVQPAVPHLLPQIPNAEGRRLTRLDFAKWLVSRDNPLTARAIMNRLWKQFFGTGISAVVDDLGAQGEWPKYPELLDWLAVEFMDSGWDLKHMSTTYRQSSDPRPEINELDPNNRWLASQSPRRLEAEFVRAC